MTILAGMLAAAILVLDFWLLRGKSNGNKLYVGFSLILPTVIVSAWTVNLLLR